MLEHAPHFDDAFAASLSRDLYGMGARASALPSERDQNFQAGRMVIKIANALEHPAMIGAQQRALAHIAATSALTPRVIPTKTGAMVSEVDGADGRRHLVWAVTHLEGAPLGDTRRRTPELLHHFGECVGTLTLALRGFDDPVLHRDFYWDLANGRRVIDEYRALVDDAHTGTAIDVLVARFDDRVAPILPSLPRSVIHGDLNDYNVLVGGGDDLFSRNQRVTGIVDFGDTVYGWTVGDLAIAAAYIMLGSGDPLSSAATLVRGYHAVTPLSENEISALFGLIALRLCTSACVAAHQRRARPDNIYLDISQDANRQTLPLLANIPFGLAEAVFRDACGLEPIAASACVRAWLAAHSEEFAPALDVELRTAADRALVLDLSVGSALVSGDAAENDDLALGDRVFGAMRAAGARVGIGRYDEPRLLYTSPIFAPTGKSDERRTIHIGLDLFAEAGTPVYAPLAGVVHAFADNAAHQDYGPVIILRHEIGDGTEFFTLYGHLSRESLVELRVGRRVARGEQFAAFGDASENGGWTPHLHLQVITDLLGLGTDFPGVGAASQRAVWRSLSPDPNLIVGIPRDRFPPAPPSKAATLTERGQRIGGNLSVAYRDPLRVARGWRQYLYDDEGRRFLDAYNNVPHVGHAHPRVVRAAASQMSVLNTNTRYLNDALTEYAERLTATLPDPLSVCYFVNSASEANELALRLARAHTMRRDMIVLEAAYHGHTNALIDLSPYKHSGRGGLGAPSWVHVAPLPDDYRGEYKRADAHAGQKYARRVAELIQSIHAGGRELAGFIAETCPSVGGQLIFPAGYLSDVYRHVRAAGGICIADEVQTGLGRMGTHFWAFEAQQVVPDVVVMGKPLGNGHPIGAVVTTRAIADSFDNGMEFFSTFGGNNVSCAVGLAVLDVIAEERLQAHALRVGDHMLGALRSLADRFPLVGDVRGSGLFVGVELVRDRGTLEPASAEASFVAERMRELGILLGTDGPHHNVIKIRPPMPFDESDADWLVDTLAHILTSDLP